MATRRRRTKAEQLTEEETQATTLVAEVVTQDTVPEVGEADTADVVVDHEATSVASNDGAPELEVSGISAADQSLDDNDSLDFGQGYGAHLRQELYKRGRAFFDNLQAAQTEPAPLHIHQLRIASRKLSAVLELFSNLIGGRPVKRLRRRLRKVRHDLGLLRDMQRQQQWLADNPLLEDYLEQQSAEYSQVLKKAVKSLSRIRVTKLEKRLELVDALLAGLLQEEQGEAVRAMLSHSVWERLLQAMACADEVDADDSLSYHALRVTMKTFRYQAEAFASAGWGTPLDQHEGWQRVKELHDALGLLQDIEVLACHLDAYWADNPPIRETQARIVNYLLKERNQALGHVHLQALDWELLWEWPQEAIEELALAEE